VHTIPGETTLSPASAGFLFSRVVGVGPGPRRERAPAGFPSRLLKKSFAAAGKDGVAVVEGQLNLDRAVVLEFG
jgi:hypothetical protein